MTILPDGTTLNIDVTEIWSCNPTDIQPWTDEKKAELKLFLADVFGWNVRSANDEQFEDAE